ncbi:hypothetical protein B0H14DRAFT_2572928 [Mycena olivaceomarginata]|nr:hypothetical protein B0H14DRAFT_2572928 [Mycena olivaceomarginata]
MPGPSAAPKPKGVRVDLNRQIQLDPHTLAIPTHVQASLKAQWNKLFPLSDLTPKNCLSTDKARINRPTTKLTLVDNALVMKEVDRDIKKEDESMTSTEFVTAGNRLVEAIQEHFKPREKAEQLAGQVAIHFDAIVRKMDFADNYPIYRDYSARVLGRFSTSPRFDVSVWQGAIWENVRVAAQQKEIAKMNMLLKTATSSSKSFRNGGGDSSQSSFRNQGANGGNAGGAGSRTNGGSKGGGKAPQEERRQH